MLIFAPKEFIHDLILQCCLANGVLVTFVLTNCLEYTYCFFKIHIPACSSRVFSEAEEREIIEPVLDDDSEEERQKKERIPHRKADIARSVLLGNDQLLGKITINIIEYIIIGYKAQVHVSLQRLVDLKFFSYNVTMNLQYQPQGQTQI